LPRRNRDPAWDNVPGLRSTCPQKLEHPEPSSLRVPIAVRSRILVMADKAIKDDVVFRGFAIFLFLE
jgi:hypothetical protein